MRRTNQSAQFTYIDTVNASLLKHQFRTISITELHLKINLRYLQNQCQKRIQSNTICYPFLIHSI